MTSLAPRFHNHPLEPFCSIEEQDEILNGLWNRAEYCDVSNEYNRIYHNPASDRNFSSRTKALTKEETVEEFKQYRITKIIEANPDLICDPSRRHAYNYPPYQCPGGLLGYTLNATTHVSFLELLAQSVYLNGTPFSEALDRAAQFIHHPKAEKLLIETLARENHKVKT